jgi:hypothetical protein
LPSASNSVSVHRIPPRFVTIATRLPRSDDAFLDIRKIENYCLSPSHPRGRHKARVFREALDIQRGDAAWLRDVLLEAARSGEAAPLQPTVGEPIGTSMRPSGDKERLLW